MPQFVESLLSWLTTGGVKIAVAFLIMLISFPIINRISKSLINGFEKKNYDKTIGKTLSYLIKIGGKILVVCCLLGYLGIDTAGISALIATLGVGVGLAVQGSLANFAGGVLIILTRPFKVDDFIEAQGVSGVVEDIHIIYTIVRTLDNKVISLPNGALANGTIINYSTKDTRRVDLTFSVSYESDYKKAIKILSELADRHELVLKDPEPFCRLSEHADSSLKIVLRLWVNSGDYWTVYFDLLEQVKVKFDEENIVIPYNQLDVHINNK